jgi:MFS family permease
VAEGQLSRSTWLPAGELVPITVSLLATLLSTFAISGITYVLLDLRLQLGLSSLQLNLLRCTAIASGLLIVFCASSLCRLFGAKRCLAVSLAMWMAGSLLMAGQTGLAMLSLGLILMGCGGAGNGRQISLLIAANTLANGLAFVASPVVNSWLLSRGAHGAVSVGLLWALLFALVLLALLLGVRGDASPSPAAAVTLRRRDWAVLLAAGACAALISTLPIIRALQPAWLPSSPWWGARLSPCGDHRRWSAASPSCATRA